VLTVEKTMRRLLLLLALSATALPGSAFGQTGGRDLYIARCSACHGPDGTGNTAVGRSLKLGDNRPAIKRMTDEQLRQLILEGKGKMPSNKKLDDEKIRSLTLFLRDLAAGNPETGRAVAEAQAQPLPSVSDVFRDKCSACHGPDGAGRTTIGKSLQIPDLTSPVVQSRSDEDLAKTISQGQGKMPAYAKKFNPVQTGQLVSYIKSLAKTGSTTQPVESAKSVAPVPQLRPAPTAQGAPQTATVPPAPGPAANAAPPNSKKEVNKKNQQPTPATTATVKRAPLSGSQIYAAKCSACHSSDGSGTGTVGKSMKIPSLISPQVQEKSGEALAEIISNGTGKMPSYKKKLSPEQIQMLVAHIRELGQKH
jgi:mono/diheme cytochrome c family protein